MVEPNSPESELNEGVTRREALKLGGGTIIGGFLAACKSDATKCLGDEGSDIEGELKKKKESCEKWRNEINTFKEDADKKAAKEKSDLKCQEYQTYKQKIIEKVKSMMQSLFGKDDKASNYEGCKKFLNKLE